MSTRRDDNDWISDLASEDASLRDDVVSDLRDMLFRGLSTSLSKNGRVNDAFLKDIVQEASIKILEKLGDFEGWSKFRTWAVTIAVRTAVSKMRKREWQNVSLESVTSDAEFNPQIAAHMTNRPVILIRKLSGHALLSESAFIRRLLSARARRPRG